MFRTINFSILKTKIKKISKYQKYIYLPGFFLILGIFSSYFTDVFLYLYLDDLQCGWLQAICTSWNIVKETVLHKFISYIIYQIGLNGFIGSILWFIEEEFLAGSIKNTLSLTVNVLEYLLLLYCLI